MHNVSSSAILCITAIVAAASIGGFAAMAVKSENASGNHAVARSDYGRFRRKPRSFCKTPGDECGNLK